MKHPLHWEPALAVGVEAFDQAHRELMERADALISAIADAGTGSGVRDVMDDLLECAVAHFAEEEQVLRQLDWPGIDTHQQAHYHLLRTLLQFKADLRYGRLAAEDAAEFISDWVCLHIQREDMQYRSFLAARGVH